MHSVEKRGPWALKHIFLDYLFSKRANSKRSLKPLMVGEGVVTNRMSHPLPDAISTQNEDLH